MKTYKDPSGKLHAIEPQYDYMLPAGSLLIAEEEAAAIREAERAAAEAAPAPDPATKLAAFLAANPDVAAMVEGVGHAG